MTHGRVVKGKKHNCSTWEHSVSNRFHMGHNLLGNTQEGAEFCPGRIIADKSFLNNSLCQMGLVIQRQSTLQKLSAA